MAKRIPLGLSGKFATVNNDVFPRLSRFSWHIHRVGKARYVVRVEYDSSLGVLKCGVPKHKNIFLHRDVLGAKKGEYVAFKSDDFLDCRRSNLVKSRKRLFPRAAARADAKMVNGKMFCKKCGEWTERRDYRYRYRNRPCKVCQTRSSRAYAQRIRDRIWDHYGRACACCGETRPEFFSLDHTNGGGRQHRLKALGDPLAAGVRFYRWVIKAGFPKGFRTLCYNCNCSRGHRGYCPHERQRAARKSRP